MINFKAEFWRVDPESIAPFVPGKTRTRSIRGGPLINLGELQAALRSGDFDKDEQLWFATKKCGKDLESEGWSTDDVLQMLVNLNGPRDFSKSEWCQVTGGSQVPCDVYATRFDAERKCNSPNGLPVYIKFSIQDDGLVTIALVSCHAS
ncbi:MAG: hypothetical protein AB9M53_07345 [Leptothrix sp. (in: b-proteobacteria)]